MPYRKEFDIDSSVFNFENDLVYGEMGEDHVVQFLQSIAKSQIEVKTDRYRNGRVAIETQQCPKRRTDEFGNLIWVNSGINVTTAKWWIYIYGIEGGSFIAIEVERLKKFLRMNSEKFNEGTKRMFAQNSDNPAKGFLLYPEDVMQMMYSAKYDIKR